MGCDIHFYFEKLNKKTNTWEPYTKIDKSEYPDNRDYEMFAFLCGVKGSLRTYGKDISRRGIPKDTSYKEYRLISGGEEYQYLGDHNFTWATIKELKNLPWKKANLEECSFVRFLGKHFLGTKDNDVRVLIGFDS